MGWVRCDRQCGAEVPWEERGGEGYPTKPLHSLGCSVNREEAVVEKAGEEAVVGVASEEAVFEDTGEDAVADEAG